MIPRLLNWLFRHRLQGARLTDAQPWQVITPGPPSRVLEALPLLAADGRRYVYFEGSFDRTLARWFAAHSVPAPLQVAPSTLWPRPDCYHVPLRADWMAEAAAAVRAQGDQAPVTHLHVHDAHRLLVEWPDAFGSDPFYVSQHLPEADVRRLAEAVGGTLSLAPAAP